MALSILRSARFLAAAHFLFGSIIASLGTWIGASCFLVLPHMSTGTSGTNLFAATMLAVTTGGPLAAGGIWMGVLGCWIWSGDTKVRPALMTTHSLFLLFGALGMIYGIFALHAAERSAAAGGGLMGAIGLVPLLIGACFSGFALWSLSIVRGMPARDLAENR